MNGVNNLMWWIFIIIIIIVWGIFLGIFIWGIIAAAKTKDFNLKIWKLLLHLFLWGGIIAAIVYVVKVNLNEKNKITEELITAIHSSQKNQNIKREE